MSFPHRYIFLPLYPSFHFKTYIVCILSAGAGRGDQSAGAGRGDHSSGVAVLYALWVKVRESDEDTDNSVV
jgi:hypothetical protein